VATKLEWHQPVASPGFGARRGTKLRENNLRMTKFYEIHAINSIYSNKAIKPVYSFWIGNHIASNVRVCATEVTRKIKQLEVEGRHVPQCPIAGDASGIKR